MDFDRTLANVNHFIDEQRRRGLDRPKLWITMVDTSVIDAFIDDLRPATKAELRLVEKIGNLDWHRTRVRRG